MKIFKGLYERYEELSTGKTLIQIRVENNKKESLRRAQLIGRAVAISHSPDLLLDLVDNSIGKIYKEDVYRSEWLPLEPHRDLNILGRLVRTDTFRLSGVSKLVTVQAKVNDEAVSMYANVLWFDALGKSATVADINGRGIDLLSDMKEWDETQAILGVFEESLAPAAVQVTAFSNR